MLDKLEIPLPHNPLVGGSSQDACKVKYLLNK
jgi:hypothetical protein